MIGILTKKSLKRKALTKRSRMRRRSAVVRVVRKRAASKKVSVRFGLRRFLRRILVSLFALLIFAIAVSVALQIYKTVVTHPYFRIKTITISGTKNLLPEKLLTAITPMFSGNIFTCDIKSATSYLEKNRWVESVSIRSQLPDSIVVDLTEREPAAALLADSGRLYLIDRHGFVLKEISRPGKYVLLTGFSGFTDGVRPSARIGEERRLEDAFKIGSIFSGDNVLSDPVAFIDVSNPERITARTSVSETVIRFGPERDEWGEKFLEYVTARKILSETGVEFGEIDLSFSNQVVVGRGVRRLEGEKSLIWKG